MKAKLVRHEKFILRKRFTIVITVHEIENSKQYPDKLKWGFICVDRVSGKKILMDNHHPKGPHIHIDDLEMPYEFFDLDQLIDDFRSLVTEHMGVQI
ncbi:MAG: hypothetical protein HOP07_15710 [Bacteriovoracaceae bacterium]|nr:hypothetical protein [Bacteriovoracaceae bacterium]